MDPLESLLQPVLRLVNGQIAQSTPARDLCEELHGRVIAVRVRDTALAVYCHVERTGISLKGSWLEEPDAVITGSLIGLGGLVLDDPERLVREGRIVIDGDVEIAAAFRRLLRFGRPDPEERLSMLIGDAGAHRAGEMLRSLGAWGERLADTMRQNIAEYVTEERGDLPARGEAEAFYRDVDRLRDDAERLEARIRALETGRRG